MMMALGRRRSAGSGRPHPHAGPGQSFARHGLFALEPRIVFDAAALATADAAADQVAQQQAEAASTSDQTAISGTSGQESAHLDAEIISTGDATLLDDALVSPDSFTAITDTRQIAFVDGSVENISELLSGLPSAVAIVVLDPSRDGVEQIADAIRGETDLTAIHILSHGSEGILRLGSATLDIETMQGEYLDELTAIGQALSAEGDILIYGCDFTSGDQGLEAAMVLGGITGADIAASSDATGATALGGDWVLESNVGTIDSTAMNAYGWSGLLAAPVAVNDGPLSMIGGVTRDIDVLSNDSDADGNTLNITGIKDPAYPNAATISIATGQTITLASGTTVKLNADQTLAVTMHPDVTSQEVFQYVVSDGTGSTATANVTIIRDTDGDGVMDSLDTDDDNDGISDVREGLATSRLDFAVADGLIATAGQTVTQTYATSNPDVTFDLTLHADIGSVYVQGVNASYGARTTDGDTSGIVIYPAGITSTTQHNTVTIKFSDAVQNVSFTYADIDGGNGISSETTTFIGKLNGVMRILTPSEVQVIVDTPPAQDGNTFSGATAGQSNAIRITFKEKIDELQIINGITSNNLNTSNPQTLFDLTFEHEKPGDSDGDGIADHQDIDSDNDGIVDTTETINTDGLSAATAFQDLGMAGTVSSPGLYHFNIGGQTFSTYVDANGYILVAIDYGDGPGDLPQVSDLTNTLRGILAPSALSSLSGATEVRLSSSDGVIDATTKDVDIIYRVAHNITLKYEGTADNPMNDLWTGTGSQYLTVDGLASTLGSTLDRNIFHASGAPSSFMWSPSANYQRSLFSSGEIAAADALYLWVKAPASPTRIDAYTDADSNPNRVDIDSDNDGITDNVEAQTTAGYIAPSGTPGAGFTDADHDGLDDRYDADISLYSQTSSVGLMPVDTDSDSKPDYIDLDSDNDGILDIAERGDGQPKSVTSLADTDSDGLLDIFEAGTINDGFDVNDSNRTETTLNLAGDPFLESNGSNAIPLVKDSLYRDFDSDNDGIIDSIDIDDDNDGILDTSENGVETLLVSWPNTSGSTAPVIQAASMVQTASNLVVGSGVTATVFSPSSIDLTGVDTKTLTDAYLANDYIQYGFTVTGLADTLTKIRFARNGTAGEYHIGAMISNDGFATATTLIDDFTAPGVTAYQRFEIGIAPYQLQPGVNYQVRVYFFSSVNATLQDFDDFALSGGEYDADNDGTINRIDIDSDNDGITDNVEAQRTAAYVAPTGNAIIADANGNGLDDVYEVASGTPGFNADGFGLAPVDTDSDGKRDYVDSDSDNDGKLDITERGDSQPISITSAADTDGDGLLDIFEGSTASDGYDVNDNNLDPTGTNFLLAAVPALSPDGSNAIPLTTDLYFRDVNNLPVDGNETATVTEDTTWTVADGASGDLLNGATDLDGDTLTISGYTIAGIAGTKPIGSAVSIPGVGTITINANGSYEFTPLANYAGPVPVITYTVSDGQGGSNTSTLSLTMSPVNDAPANTVPGSGWTTNEDTPVTVTGLSITDVDAAAGTMTVTLKVSSGTLTATTDGNVAISGSGTDTLSIAGTLAEINAFLAGTNVPTFSPVANANGSVTLTVTTNDLGNTGSGGALTDVDTATITVNPVNDPPVDGNETASVTEDTTLTVNDGDPGDLLNNATDVEGNPLSITGYTIDGITGTQGVGIPVEITGVGTIKINANGSYEFAPAANYTGTVPVITYTVSDGNSGADTSTLSLSMIAVNDAPVAVNDSYTTDQNTSFNSDVTPGTSGQDYDVDGTFTVTQINGAAFTAGAALTLPSGALLTINADGTFTYDPNGKFDHLGSGQQGTDSFSYRITDNLGATSTATATITVNGLDDTISITGTSDGAVSGTDGTALESDLASGTNPAGTGETVTGSFTIAAIDTIGSFTVGGTTVTGSDVITGTYGTLTITNFNATTGVVSYSYALTGSAPHSGAVTEDFAIVLTDGDGDQVTDTLSFSITDDVPVANLDLDHAINRSGNPESTATGNVVTGIDTATTPDSDTDDGTADKLGADSPTSPVTGVVAGAGTPLLANIGNAISGAYGTLTLSADGTYVYAPDFANPTVANLSATSTLTDTFTYQITDSDGSTATTTLSFEIFASPAVTNLNEGSVAGTDGSVFESDLANGSTPSGTGETLNSTFRVLSMEPIVSISVAGTTIAYADLLASSSTPLDINTTYGTIQINGFDDTTGLVSYTYGLTGSVSHSGGDVTDDIAVSITDQLGDTGNGVLKVFITDDSPTAVADVASVTEDTTLSASGNVISDTGGADTIGADANASPVTGLSFGVTAGTVGSPLAGTYGSLTLQADGSYTYGVTNTNPAVQALAAGESLTEVFTYTITDGDGDSTNATLTITINGTNDAPTSTSITNQFGNDADIVSVDVSSHFADADTSDTLAFSAAGLPTGLIIDPDTGIISGTIDNSASQGGAAGTYTVTITATDPNNVATQQTFTWTVSNPAPVAADDDLSTTENANLSGSVFADNGNGADTDPDGDTFDVSLVNGLAGNVGADVMGSGGGTFKILTDGSYTFTPGTAFDDLAAGETRTTATTYTISDGEGGTSTATVTITVTGTNDTPTPTALANRSNNDSDTVSLELGPSFTDPDTSDALTFTATGLPPGLSIDPATGIISGTIDHTASVNGPYTVTVTATDPHNLSTQQSFAWNVTNPSPVAQNDAFTTVENASLSGSVLADNGNGVDVDADGDTLYVSQVNGQPGSVGADVTGTMGGTFKILSDGSYTFDPGTDFDDLAVAETRSTQITYTISDGQGGTSTATVAITITGTNDAPTSTTIPTLYSVDSGVVSFNAGDNFTDPDTSDALTFTATGLPPGLSIDPDTGAISGTIDHSASLDGPYTVTVRATDPYNVTTQQTFTWNVANLAPVAQNDAFSTAENAGLAGSVLIDNGNGADADPDGDALVVSAVNGLPESVGSDFTGSTGGTFKILVDGSYTFDPGTDFDNLAVNETRTTQVTYTISDGQGGTSSATIAVTVTGTNDAPTSTALQDQSSNDRDMVALDVSGNFADRDTSDTLTYAAAGLPPGLAIDPPTGIVYGTIDPSASLYGPYTVTITATDPGNATTQRSFTWNVANPAPVARDDALSTTENAGIAGSLLTDNGNGADTDPDGDTFTVSQVNGQTGNVGANVTGSAGGTFRVVADGSYSFDPGTDFDNLPAGETRVTQVTYTISDGQGGTSIATVAVTVTGTNDAPAGQDSSFTVVEDGTLQGRALATDVDGDRLTFSGPVTNPAHGTVTISPDGTFSYRPDLSYFGDDSFIVLVDDGHGGTTTSTVTIEVTPVAVITPQPETPTPLPSIPLVSTPLVVDGIVLDTVSDIVPLGQLPIDIKVSGIVIETVNAISRLDTFAGRIPGIAEPGTVISHPSDLARLAEAARSASPALRDHWDAQATVGHSVRMNVDVGGEHRATNHDSQIVVETLVRDRLLFVQISNTLDRSNDNRVVDYAILQADGRPLPSWANIADRGQIMVQRPIDNGTLDLKITTRLADRPSVTRYVTIQLATGEVQHNSHLDRPTPPLFEEQLRRAR